jgi:predicted Rossmann fold nucleotide-binding protein DprA/Smf involved in DNA uptake
VDPQDFDEIARRVALSPEAILTRLSRLELSGHAARRAGGRFVRCLGKVIT